MGPVTEQCGYCPDDNAVPSLAVLVAFSIAHLSLWSHIQLLPLLYPVFPVSSMDK